MSDKATYAVRMDGPKGTTFLNVTFDEAPSGERPVDGLGDVFRASLMSAAAAFDDPNVREVPIYREGDLRPAAYLTRPK